jgi:2-C-methyl-D-erythritol 2,4-cyclodiphosphate synthase
MKDIRIGYGFDLHRLKEGRRLILGGVDISFEKGLDGHSDADALLHAITDAMLGALALGDIGKHFPDTDPLYKDVDSRVLLRAANTLITEKGYFVGNIDATIVAERPKMNPHIPEMVKRISEDLSIEPSRISIKATTSEKIGAMGREEGISATASILLFSKY